MDGFEKLLYECRGAVERFVKFKLPSSFDADDVLQEIYMAANARFDALNDKSIFKAWLIGIARHKCNYYFRKRAKIMEIPLDEVSESALGCGRMGISETSAVRETLSKLANREQEILYLYFFREMPQAEIAKKLNIPLGTVKSRLHTAKANFKENYPYPPVLSRNESNSISKGDCIMKKLPEIMPEYKIVKSAKEPFSVVWEELMGWFLVPKLGERLS
ncbi:MAG: sigma-70 family RNA polymerase sigma factor [Eubacteriales bacterium]|nr:sigma-70 family RNA polymerase sigma factor [Eubacteriales bacterium]MDD4513406.1 sigma-70 family RNA polymerase sigma factor [Eubacteriales bacterium]